MPASWKPSIPTPRPALRPASACGTSGLQPVVIATPPAIQPHVHPKAPPPLRAGLPSDLSLMSVLCHQTLKFSKAGVGFPLSFTRPGAQEMPVGAIMGQMDLGGPPPLISPLPCPHQASQMVRAGRARENLPESHGGAVTAPKVSTWKSEGSHLCLGHPTPLQGLSVLHPSLLPSPPPPPRAHPLGDLAE